MAFMDPKYETHHILLGIRKTKVVLNSLLLNFALASTVRRERSIKLSRTTRAYIGTHFTSCLYTHIVKLVVIYLINFSLRAMEVRETPITVVCWIELSILIGTKDF